jgi:hypothetical protein
LVSAYKVRIAGEVVGEHDESVPEVHGLVLQEVDAVLLGLGLSVEAVLARDVTQDRVRLRQLHVSCQPQDALLQQGRPFALKLDKAGLPDGIFSNQKSQFGSILKSLTMKDVDLFYGHLIYFTANWYTCYDHLAYFVVIWYIFPVLVCCTKKNLATLDKSETVIPNSSKA